MLYRRKMGLDYGDVRIGIAISDLTAMIATGFETYVRVGEQKDIEHIVSLIKDKLVDTVVIGLPVNMDGSEGVRVVKTRDFIAKLLEKVDVKVVYLDERLTSQSAERILINADVRRENRKNIIDKLAATIILQDFLDRHPPTFG